MHFKTTWNHFLRCIALAGALAAAPSFAANWHEDGDAGVRVRLPFSPAMVKTGRQVEALIRELEPDGISGEITYTSGVYAAGGTPYFLIWKRSDAAAPTRRELQQLAADPDAGRAFNLTQFSFDPVRLLGRGLVFGRSAPPRQASAILPRMERRVLFQLARGETVFLGYYSMRPEHAAYFEELAASLELAPHLRLDPQQLARGALSSKEILALTLAVAFGALAVVFLLAMRASARQGQLVAHALLSRTP